MVGIDRFDYWIYYWGNDMSKIGDYNLQQQQDLADKGDYSHEDCREPAISDYQRQCMAKPEFEQEMEDIDQEDIDQDAGYDEYKEKRAGLFPEIDLSFLDVVKRGDK